MTDPRRRIPGIGVLSESDAARPLFDRYPRDRVIAALRSAVDEVRAAVAGGSVPEAIGDPETYSTAALQALEVADVPSLQPVINGSGVVLHTNLGRAPLAPDALDAIRTAGAGYSNLEYDLAEGVRGSRYDHCVSLLTELTGAEDALVVNNCAASLVLVFSALARGRDVLVSRGELVEIGGGFRIPEIMEQSGARLAEIGSTNRTRLGDYRDGAEGIDLAAILKVHRSNFRISGFTEEASLDELVDLGREAGVPVVYDLGSGLLADPERLGLPGEPRPVEAVAAGADLVVFSGDKLLGGPQAGVIVGRADLVARLRACPLCRAVRVDKTTLAALEATLRLYRDPRAAVERIPVLAMLAARPDDLRSRADALAGRLAEAEIPCDVRECVSVVGGGTYPGVELPSWSVCVFPGNASTELRARTLRTGGEPVVLRVDDDGLHVDLRTVLPGQVDRLVARIVEVWKA